ncbi:MAG: S41 family peptidase [Planctomycetota bacterium]
MNNRLIGNLSLVAALAVLMTLLMTYNGAWARSSETYRQIDLLIDLRHELATEYVDEPDQQDIIEGAINGMIEALDDPYTQYFPIEEFQAFNDNVQGEFEGIGAEVTIENNRLHIVTPLEDSPAWEAGVMAGDTVLEVDGTDTLNLSINDAVKLLKGPAGTDVTIRVRHASGEEEDITITRAKIEVQTVRGFGRDADHKYSYTLDPVNNIGYIRLTQFSTRTAEEALAVMKQLKAEGVEGLVLDLRFNPGGLLDAAVKISDAFLGEGQRIVSVRGRVVPEQVFESTSDTLMGDTPVVVLANSFSASASEIVAGALSDNGRALFVGERTFGKGSVQQVKILEGGQGALKLTNAYYYLPSGRNIHRRNKAEGEPWGVDPTEGAYVPMDADARRAMIEARRARDRIDEGNGNMPDEPITPQWIESILMDPQLAAAHRALLGKLETGEWPTVGESNADALAMAAEQANLLRQRELLEETLAEVNEKLVMMEAGQMPDAEADHASSDATTPNESEPADAVESVVERDQAALEEANRVAAVVAELERRANLLDNRAAEILKEAEQVRQEIQEFTNAMEKSADDAGRPVLAP